MGRTSVLVAFLAAFSLSLGCQTVSAGIPAPCPELSELAREQRDHLMQLDEAGRIFLPPIGAHGWRTDIGDLVVSWREVVRYCQSVDAYRD